MTDILIIEDNEELGTLVHDFLKREGYSVQLARSAEEGLELIGKAAFKMLLLDVMLPGMNG
ncbi:MAG: response regulator, partial [Lachnospiraceae bacterium]|nr:response regulator [Lachnospiraceae bacterium]